MVRTAIITTAILLMTSSLVHADDRDVSLLYLRPESRYQHSTDMNMSDREYEEIYSRNRKLVLKNLRSYSTNALESIGVPEQGIKLMGASLNLLFKDAQLNLNRSKTLALEVKDVKDADRTLFFKVKLDW